MGKQTFFYKVRKSQIRKFLRYARPQIANPKILLIIRKLQIRKFLQNIAQLCLKTVLKVVFLMIIYNIEILIGALYAIFVGRKVCFAGLAEGLSPQITKSWVRKSQIRKRVTFAEGPQI